MSAISNGLPWYLDRRWQWACCVVLALALSTLVPEPSQWAPALRSLGAWFWPIFLLLQCCCALLMVPSLPLVGLAALLFPGQAQLVLLMAIVGVIGSATLIYHFSHSLGLTRSFAEDQRAAVARTWIQRHGALALALWSAAPFLPTDLGCYLAASARVPFGRYLVAIVLGESLLCASVVWSGQHLANLI